MIPLRIVESERDGFDQPVVELWRDDDFVGMVFWDEDAAVVQVYADEDGDVFDLGAEELMTALETAQRIVTPEEFQSDELFSGFSLPNLGSGEDDALDADDDWAHEHPATVTLVSEFDALAVYRGEDGEGFFPRSVALDFLRRCDELDLAVVEMEGFDLEGDVLIPRPTLDFAVRTANAAEWHLFRPTTNATAVDTLTDWPARPTLVAAFVVMQPDGESFVA